MRRGAADYLLKDRLARLGMAVRQAIESKRAREEKRAAADAVRESEALYRDLVENSRDLICTHDQEGNLLSVNAAAPQLTGYTRQALLQMNMADLLNPDVRESFGQYLKEVLGRGRAEGLIKIQTAGGEIRHWEYFCTLRTEGVAPVLLGVARDVTERRRAVQDLRNSEERHRLLFQSSPLPMWVYDLETLRFLAVNQAAVSHYGYSETEFLTMTIGAIRPPEDLSRLKDALARREAGSERISTTWRHRKKNGEIIDVEVTSDSLAFDGREARLVVAIDVTEQRRMDRDREDLTRRLELVLQSTDEGLYAVDLDGTCILANRSANRLLGYEPGELIGRHVHATMHHTKGDGHPYPASECRICPAEQAGQTVRTSDNLFWTKSGTSFPVETACSPIFEGGAVSGAVVTFTDITRSRAVEKQLETANRLSSLGRLAATIAHEFNNVLMGIQPFAEVIARNAAHQENVVKAAGHITSCVKRGKRITQEILRFTQPAQPVLRPIGVQSWLRDLEVEARSLLPEGIALVMQDGSRHFQQMQGDPAQLQQIFVNLVLNAKDAMPHGGCLTVSAAVDRDDTVYPFGIVVQPSRYVHVTVSDTGSGMSGETMDHIFEPLFTTKPTGTGLGLAVTHQVVKRHGGEVLVESKEGVGTSFHLFIPRANGEQVDVAPTEEPLRRPSECIRLLLVEDDVSISEGLVSILELEGFQVDAVDRGALAAEAVSRFAPDAVVLDVGLPDMSGIDVYLQIAKTWPDLPVIFSTGEGDLSKLEKLLDRKNVGYLLKPYEIEVLLDCLARLLPQKYCGALRERADPPGRTTLRPARSDAGSR